MGGGGERGCKEKKDPAEKESDISVLLRPRLGGFRFALDNKDEDLKAGDADLEGVKQYVSLTG